MWKGHAFHPHREWFNIREQILCFTGRDVPYGDLVARFCASDHPEAVWLKSVLTFHFSLLTPLLLVNVLPKDHMLGRSYAAVIRSNCCFREDHAKLLIAAEEGFAPAQRQLAKSGRFEYWKKAADLGDREALYHEGRTEEAIYAGEYNAFREKGLSISGPERYIWLARAADAGSLWGLDELQHCACKNLTDDHRYALGRAFYLLNIDERVHVNFYLEQLEAARTAAITGFLCLRRILFKDVALLIAHLVWSARTEGNYVLRERDNQDKRARGNGDNM